MTTRQPIPYSCAIQARPGYPGHPGYAERIMDYVAYVAGVMLTRDNKKQLENSKCRA